MIKLINIINELGINEPISYKTINKAWEELTKKSNFNIGGEWNNDQRNEWVFLYNEFVQDFYTFRNHYEFTTHKHFNNDFSIYPIEDVIPLYKEMLKLIKLRSKYE
jgi:hypothetical protein